MNQFSRKEVLKILNITKETLRYYENKGLISPSINPENHYRIYTDQDIFQLALILKFRAMDTSINEIKNFKNIESIECLEDEMENKLSDLNKKRCFLEAIVNKNEKRLDLLKAYRKNPYMIQETPAFKTLLFPLHSALDDFEDNQNSTDPYAKMDRQDLPLSDFSFLIEKQNFPMDINIKKAVSGLSYSQQWASILNLGENLAYLIDYSLAITFIQEESKSGDFHASSFNFVLEYLENLHYEITGSILATIIFETKSSRYFQFWIPVQNKQR